MTASRPADSPALLRRVNSAAVFHSVRANGPVSRADLARATGLSKPTVNGAVDVLLGRIVLSRLGDETVALGGVRLALRRVEQMLFDFVAVEPA